MWSHSQESSVFSSLSPSSVLYNELHLRDKMKRSVNVQSGDTHLQLYTIINNPLRQQPAIKSYLFRNLVQMFMLPRGCILMTLVTNTNDFCLLCETFNPVPNKQVTYPMKYLNIYMWIGKFGTSF